MHPENLVIINTWDKPHPKLLMIENPNGKFVYINNDIRSRHTNEFDKLPGTASLKDFGFEVKFNEEKWCAEYTQTQGSVATYADGKEREWQGPTKFTFLDIIFTDW